MHFSLVSIWREHGPMVDVIDERILVLMDSIIKRIKVAY
jgi:hypothetical protein